MKQLASLLLALMMSLCCLLPAVAETSAAGEAPAAFPFTLVEFQAWHNTLITKAGLDGATAWTVSGDGLTAVADAGELGRFTAAMNEAGLVTGLSIECTMTAETMQTGAYYFGGSISLVIVAVMAAADPASLSDAVAFAELEKGVAELISALFARIGEVAAGRISESGVVAGRHVTVYAACDPHSMALTLGFTCTP